MSRESSRWTFTKGSRPEGVAIYDADLKFHSHHDSDPARGQQNAYDLVRLHRFGHLDVGHESAPIGNRPSSIEMARFANDLPEIRAERARTEFDDLGELPLAAPDGVKDEPGSPPARFTVRSASEFGSGPPMDWIVRGILPRAELAVIFGESGSGKSFATLDLCAAITRGLSWRGRRTVRGRVVYVCAEGSSGFKSRLKAYSRAHSVPLDELPSIIADAPNLLDPKDAALLTHSVVEWIAKQGGTVDVIAIDTLSATTPGGNENSGEDMGLVLAHCKLLSRKAGALVILIHHSGKDAAKGARGWSGLRAAADAEIEILRNGDYRSAAVTKMKDGTDGENFSFKLKVVPLGLTPDGEEESSCVVEHIEAAPEAATGKQRPAGSHQTLMFDTLKTMAPSGTVNYEDLVAGYAKKMPRGEGVDRSKRDAKRALEGLIAKRLAFMHGEDRVSLTSLVTSDTGDWLE